MAVHRFRFRATRVRLVVVIAGHASFGFGGTPITRRPPFATRRLATLLHALGRTSDALDHLKTYVQIFPESAWGRVFLGIVLAAQQMVGGALHGTTCRRSASLVLPLVRSR